MASIAKKPQETSESSAVMSEKSNGATSPFSSPAARNKRRRQKRIWIIAVVACLLATATGAAWLLIKGSDSESTVIWSPAKVQDIQLTITEQGELQSANNVDITCQVKIGTTSRGPTIRWLVDAGSYVRKGEDLLKLEDSAFQKNLLDQEIVLKRAQNEYKQAVDHLEIVKSQGEADIRVAELNVETAEIDLERYTEGEYKKLVKDVESRRLLAKSDVERWEERVAFVRRMVRKKSYSKAQLDAALDSLNSAAVALSTLDEEHRVLTKYDIRFNRKQKEGLVAQHKSDLARARIQAKALENQAINDRDTKEAVYKQELNKFNEIKTEIDNCTIRAPKDGLVVYYESARSRRSSESEKIEVGSTVYEGQKLMQIPDLRKMLVLTRVHEALISNVRGEKYKRTGFAEALQLSMLTNPSPHGRLLGLVGYPAVRRSPSSEWIKDRDEVKTFDGLRAEVTLEAFPGRVLPGRVTIVSTVASKAWYSEVRSYEAVVEVTGDVSGLKPGMSANVKIYTDRRVDNALAVPVQAVFRQFDKGRLKHFVYVKGPKGAERREIEIGITNDRVVQVKSGLQDGELVAENPLDIEKVGDGEIVPPGESTGRKRPGGGTEKGKSQK